MPLNPLHLVRKSLSNPAWLRAKISERALRAPEEADDMQNLLKWLHAKEAQTGALSPETSFLLQRNVEKLRRPPTQNAEQLRFEEFKEGGLAQLRKMLSDPSTYVDAVQHVYQRNPFSATEREHAQVYNRLGDELRSEYGGKSGSVTDRAKNYAGGWDYATRDPQNAERRAALWQFKDYLTSPFSEASRADAGYDLDENLAGVRDALRFTGPPEPYRELKNRAVRWAGQNPRGR